MDPLSISWTIILQGFTVARNSKRQKSIRNGISLFSIVDWNGTLSLQSSITTGDHTGKDDEDVAWTGKLRITLRVRPSRVAVLGLQRIPPCTLKRIANSSSVHRSVSMAARLTYLILPNFDCSICVIKICNE